MMKYQDKFNFFNSENAFSLEIVREYLILKERKCGVSIF